MQVGEAEITETGMNECINKYVSQLMHSSCMNIGRRRDWSFAVHHCEKEWAIVTVGPQLHWKGSVSVASYIYCSQDARALLLELANHSLQEVMVSHDPVIVLIIAALAHYSPCWEALH